MAPALSLYLDFVRFSAAMIVFFGHISGDRFTGGLFWQFGLFMDEAVTVFFVLSGYVIAYVIDTRERSVEAYSAARAARVLSVAVPAVLLTFLLDTVGRTLRPDLYGLWWGYQTDGQLWQFLSALLFIGRLWYMEVGVGSNLPYWSLHYEVWYYIIFAGLVFAPKRWRVPAVIGLLLLVGPPIVVLFPVWLMGVVAYRISASGQLGPVTGAFLALACLVLLFLLEFAKLRYGQLPSMSVQPRMTNDYVVGLLFSAHLVGVQAAARRIPPVPAFLEAPIRWLAGATFTIYLLHLPVSQFLTTVVPWPPDAWQTRLVIFGGGLVILFAIAAGTERRKDIWRRGIGWVTRSLRPKAGT